MTYKQLATKMGITESQCRSYGMDWLQSEGYLETERDVIECETLEQYIRLIRRPAVMTSEEERAILACEAGEICGAG